MARLLNVFSRKPFYDFSASCAKCLLILIYVLFSKSFHISSFIVQLLHVVSIADICGHLPDTDRSYSWLIISFFIFLVYMIDMLSPKNSANTNESHT